MQKKDEQPRKSIFQERRNQNQETGRGLVSLEFNWMPKILETKTMNKL
jgi:hypothetical protein